jgi:isoleucyl-tRNA synthetase
MNDMPAKAKKDTGPDYSATLFLPQTDFPMRGGLPQKEPEILARWEKIDLYGRLRQAAQGRAKFVLHDGPPYANGNIHIGHALNKILKDMVTRSQQMLGKDSNYVPGWDCHGLPIEWKIEEQYRAKGKNKDAVPVVEFRQECRTFAEHWVGVQREEFKRLGITGDWAHPYLTMSTSAEAHIAAEIMKFAANGTLYRGSKPVMWSVVEKTALAEAEVEYEDYTSDTVYVAFPVSGSIKYFPEKDYTAGLFSSAQNAGKVAEVAAQTTLPQECTGVSVVIWTTTPWTIPGNRAIAYSRSVEYGLYRVTESVRVGGVYVLAKTLADAVFKAARVDGYKLLGLVADGDLANAACAHPFAGHMAGYDFPVPLLPGDHVTDDAGTGFVHTAPGHGREDFDIWMANGRELAARGIETRIPYTVDADGFFTEEAPGFAGKRVITDKGDKGDANEAVIKALIAAGNLVARGKLKHQYPHSWRSKKPVIFRNTPQWFIAMDKPIAGEFAVSPSAPHPNPLPAGAGRGSNAATLRDLALEAIQRTRWVPAAGENRITGMIANRPDWVVSRQRAWGVPIAVFMREEADGSVAILQDEAVNARIVAAFEAEGADAWYEAGAAERFLGARAEEGWVKVDDILDVWFDSGSTHSFTLEDPVHFPGLAGIRRKADGGPDEVMYLEGSDQHRGWFHSSLLESCGTRGRAPFDIVLTHGFTLDEQGRKMSKSLGNQTFPQDVIKASGADILRLWVASVDYADDQRIGPEILKSTSDTYRKLRNTLRWMLGTLHHFDAAQRVAQADMPEIERLMLHRLVELDAVVRAAYGDFDYNRVIAALSSFMTSDLSAFYFDVRKDALYCDPLSSRTRLAALSAIDEIFRRVTIWLAPILAFTAEEAWLARAPDAVSIHLETFPETPSAWRDAALAEKWALIRRVRRVVTGALEIERAQKRIGSSLEAAPVVSIGDPAMLAALEGVDFAEVCITSAIEIVAGEGPPDAFRLDDVPGVAVVSAPAPGRKCARSWKLSPLVGSDGEFPDVTPRDAQALRELRAAGRWP